MHSPTLICLLSDSLFPEMCPLRKKEAECRVQKTKEKLFDVQNILKLLLYPNLLTSNPDPEDLTLTITGVARLEIEFSLCGL